MNRRAFVLIELLVVMAIISVLGAMFAPKILSAVNRSKAAQCLSNRYSIEQAEARYRIDHDGKPSPSVTTLKEGAYLDRVPYCTAKGFYVWVSTSSPQVGCSVHYWPYETASGNAALFSSEFNSMNMLRVLSGHWVIAGEILKGWSTKSEAQLSFGDNGWTDYSIKLNATLSAGNGYGVYYRADGKTDISGYAFQFDAALKAFTVRKVVNGVESAPLGTAAIPAGFPVYDTQHLIEVSVSGNTQTIYVDSVKVLTVTDSTFTSGSAGLQTWGTSKAQFDSVAVTAN